jgi:hypothetical protein
MKTQTKTIIALFLGGFFAKDVVDSAGFLLTDNYPLHIFGITITAIHHKVMLVVSTILTGAFLYYGLRSARTN